MKTQYVLLVSLIYMQLSTIQTVTNPGIILWGGLRQGFFLGGEGGSKSSVEDRGQRDQGSGSGSPLVRGSTQFANE
jgi:hypothetical protein